MLTSLVLSSASAETGQSYACHSYLNSLRIRIRRSIKRASYCAYSTGGYSTRGRMDGHDLIYLRYLSLFSYCLLD